MVDTVDIDLFLGLDLGKEFHHAHGLTGQGKTVHDRRLPNTEPKLRELFEKLVAKFGTVLVVVDQVANIGALPIAAARASGCRVAYLPGLSMRRAADLYPGEAKTDARDAFVIADAARAMPHTLHSVDLDDETIAELHMIVGFDDDLAAEATRLSSRLRGLFTQIHPHLERVLGPRMQHPAVLRLLDQFGSPAQIRKAGRRRLTALIRPKAPRMAERLINDIFTALDEQTVVVPGTDAAALIVPSLASSLQAVLDQRKLLAKKEGASPTWKKSFGFHPLAAWCANTGECLAMWLRTGGAGSNTVADHLRVLRFGRVRERYDRRKLECSDDLRI